MKEKFLIRCRETGLFYRTGMRGPWVAQSEARRFDKSNAEWYRNYLAETKHCVHIVPEGWTPAVEKDALRLRVLAQLQAIYNFFKH